MDTTKINHISLCSGYGGIDLGLRAVLPDVRTIAYVEIDAFAVANLVAKMEEGGLDAAPVWTDIKTFDARPFRGKVDILSGGFPCQPFSHAGQRKGTEDPRHLFPSIERIVSECSPRIIFLENVEGIISTKYEGEPETSVLKHVLERLEELGYYSQAVLVSASEVSAPHRRKRIFIMGISYDDRERLIRLKESNCSEESLEESLRNYFDRLCELLSNTICERHGGRTESVGQEGEASESDHGDSVRCEVDGLCSLEGSGELADTRCDDGTQGGESNRPRGVDKTRRETCEEGGEHSIPSECSGELAHSRRNQCGGRSTLGEVQEVNGREEEEGKESSGRGEDNSGQREVSEPCNEGTTGEGLADSSSQGLQGGELKESHSELVGEGGEGTHGSVAKCGGQPRPYWETGFDRLFHDFPARPNEQQFEWEQPRVAKPELGGSPHGSSTRVDRLRLLGNGVVPQCCSKAFLMLVSKILGDN